MRDIDEVPHYGVEDIQGEPQPRLNYYEVRMCRADGLYETIQFEHFEDTDQWLKYNDHEGASWTVVHVKEVISSDDY